jgi:hypothetical protein
VKPLAAAALALAAAALLVAGCGKSERPKTDAAAEQAAAAQRAREGPYGGDLKALDKAKGLGEDLNRKAQEEGEQADRMSR